MFMNILFSICHRLRLLSKSTKQKLKRYKKIRLVHIYIHCKSVFTIQLKKIAALFFRNLNRFTNVLVQILEPTLNNVLFLYTHLIHV